jgi:hypothetical protein
MNRIPFIIGLAIVAVAASAYGYDIFNEDFEDYNVGEAMVSPWLYTSTNSDNGLVADTESKAGDNSLYFYDEGDNSWGVYYDPPSALRKGTYKFSVFFPTTDSYLFWYQSHEDGTGIRILISPADWGGVYYYYNTTRYVHWNDIPTGTWHDFQVDFDHTDGADGTFDIYWNGDRVCTGAAIDGSINNMNWRSYFAAGGSNCEVYIDNYSLSVTEETELYFDSFEDTLGAKAPSPWVYSSTNVDNGLEADTQSLGGDQSLYFYDEVDNSWSIYQDPVYTLADGTFKFSILFPGGADSFLKYYQSTGSVGASNLAINLLFSPSTNGGVYDYKNTTRYVHWDNIDTDVWYDVEIVFDHTAGDSGTFDIYWDGDKVCTAAAIDAQNNSETYRAYAGAGGNDCSVYVDNYALTTSAAPALPGNYVISQKGKNSSGDIYNRLAMYDFDGSDATGTVTQIKEWQWKLDDTLTWYGWSLSDRTIGTGEDTPPGNIDTTKKVVGLTSFLSNDTAASSDVEILGSWASGTSHAEESGSNRLLLFTAHTEDNDGAIDLGSVTYGGQSMTKITEYVTTESGYTNYSVAYMLKESGIASATTSTFSPNWGGNNPDRVGYSSVFLGNVDQTSTIIDSGTGGSNTASTITTPALSTNDGDLVVLAATAGNTGDYTCNNSFVEGIELSITSTDGVSGTKLATGSDETPSVTHSKPYRQVIIGFVVGTAGATGPDTGTWTLTGSSISIDWSNGDTESWYITWEDPGYLYKIELVDASYLYSGTNCYLTEDAVTYANGDLRDTTAVNAAWGFGSTMGFDYAVGEGTPLHKDLSGMWIQHTTYETPAEYPVQASSASFGSVYHITDNDVVRNVEPEDGYGPQYFYLAPPETNNGDFARRVVYQSGHDFDRDGYIEDNGGHIMGALQIIDNAGKYRGLVVVQYQATNNSANDGWTSAFFWLDDGDKEVAKTGVLAD